MSHYNVSVITASLNPGRTLSFCLDSVEKQEGVFLEHIVVDGGSTDGTLEFLKSRMTHRLVWISEPDNGIADAMNKGARLAQGEWLLFLQADDVLSNPRNLFSAMKSGDPRNSDLIACGILFGSRMLLPANENTNRTGWPWWTAFKQPFRHQGLLISRKAWVRVGPYREDFSITMDFDWMLRAYWLGLKVARVGLVLAEVGTTGVSSSSSGEGYRLRLTEEQRAREANAPNFAWKVAYRLFWSAYRSYKRAGPRAIEG